MIITQKMIVTGYVQGVWYRKFVSDTTRQLGINGWVYNARDGSVEILAQGQPDNIEKLVSELWRGTPLSDVQAIDQMPSQEEVGEGFYVR